MVKFLVSGDNYFYHMEQWIEKDLHYMCGIGTIYHTKNLEMPYCRLEGIIYEVVLWFRKIFFEFNWIMYPKTT